jgi:hypothetical protein
MGVSWIPKAGSDYAGPGRQGKRRPNRLALNFLTAGGAGDIFVFGQI